MKKHLTWKKVVLVIIVVLAVIWFSIKPSNNRHWNSDQQILPEAIINGDQAIVKNIRNFTYRTTDDYTTDYYDKIFDLTKITKAYYIIEPFSKFAGSAHTFLSFEFEPGNFVAISIEIRKEQGEIFSPFKGLLKQYEIMYVIGDERDLVKLRSNYRHDQVFVYPIKASPEQVRTLFVNMLKRANNLKTTPEFYNTVFNSCTTNIADQVNIITPGKIPFSLAILFPGYSDKLAYNLGLLDTNLPFDQARQKYLINDRALKYADDPNFSVRIRE